MCCYVLCIKTEAGETEIVSASAFWDFGVKQMLSQMRKLSKLFKKERLTQGSLEGTQALIPFLPNCIVKQYTVSWHGQVHHTRREKAVIQSRKLYKPWEKQQSYQHTHRHTHT